MITAVDKIFVTNALLGAMALLLSLLCAPAFGSQNSVMAATAQKFKGLKEMNDVEMSTEVAQGLFVTDKISGSDLAGANAYSMPFTFYRMGLDGELDLNMNIDKLQLGCGGINDFIGAKAGCDINIDYAQFMGRNGNNLGTPLSDFRLIRPYIEVAVKNGNNPAQREVVGIKIGAQAADGAISVGRRYDSGSATLTNQENMYTTTYPDQVAGGTQRPDNVCIPGSSLGGGVLGCHSGINSVSGFLGAEMSLQMDVKANICTLGIIGSTCLCAIGLDAWGCIGKLTTPQCSSYANTPLFVDIAGTRMESLALSAAKLDLSGNGGLSSLFTSLVSNAYASLNANLRLVHQLVFNNTSDFFLSFQREPVAYPRYDKLAPVNDPAVTNDSCKTADFASARCGSAYAVPANTGWWLNAPSVKLTDVTNNNAQLGNVTLTQALNLLAPPGLLLSQAEFQLTPAQNCRGYSRFC
jgi:hypothetical protein